MIFCRYGFFDKNCTLAKAYCYAADAEHAERIMKDWYEFYNADRLLSLSDLVVKKVDYLIDDNRVSDVHYDDEFLIFGIKEDYV